MNNNLLLLSACVLLSLAGFAQCADSLACNFDPASEGSEVCIYFDTDLFGLDEIDFIGNYEFEECDDGLTGWDDLVVDLFAPTGGGPLALNVSDFAGLILISSGLEALYADLTTASLSVCGDTMHYLSTVEGELSLAWDGLGFENPALGGYLAPESSYPSGCANPTACNFEPCPSPADTASCELLEPGTIVGDTLVANGAAYTYTYEDGQPGSTYVYYTACGEVAEDEQGGDNVVTFVFDFPQECELCIEENQPTCSVLTCLTLTPDATNLVAAFNARWSIRPNPARDVLNVHFEGKAEPWAFYDGTGREVQQVMVQPGNNAISVSALAQGTYLFGPLTGPKRQVQILN